MGNLLIVLGVVVAVGGGITCWFVESATMVRNIFVAFGIGHVLVMLGFAANLNVWGFMGSMISLVLIALYYHCVVKSPSGWQTFLPGGTLHSGGITATATLTDEERARLKQTLMRHEACDLSVAEQVAFDRVARELSV